MPAHGLTETPGHNLGPITPDSPGKTFSMIGGEAIVDIGSLPALPGV